MVQVSDTGNILMPVSFTSSFKRHMQKRLASRFCASSIRKARNCRNRSTRWGRRFRLYDEASAAVSPITADALRERLRLVAVLGLCRSWANYRPCTFREVCVDHVRFDALREELIDVERLDICSL